MCVWLRLIACVCIIVQLIGKRSKAQQVSLVSGDLILRDGAYSTDAQVRYVLQGVVYPHRRVVILFANAAKVLHCIALHWLLSRAT
jgi:hypothetical protein